MVRDGLNLGDELDDLGGLVVGVSVVLVVLFPLEDEKNVDVNQLFSGHVCLLENMFATGADAASPRDANRI